MREKPARTTPCAGEVEIAGDWRPCPQVARSGPPLTQIEWWIGRTVYCQGCVDELPDENEGDES